VAPSHPAFRAVGAINAAQDPEAVPFFAHTGSHWPGVPLGLRERRSTTGTVPVQYRPSGRAVCRGCRVLSTRQDPEAVPFFARTRQPPLTLAAVPCARLRERGSTLCLCNTDHPAGPRIRKQDSGPVGARGAWPVRPAAPAAAPGKHIVVCCGWHIACYDIAYDVVATYRMFLAM
jgi:hypothetical protein